MKKSLIAITVAGLFAGTASVNYASEVTMSGFVNSVFVFSNDACDNLTKATPPNPVHFLNGLASRRCVTDATSAAGGDVNSEEKTFFISGELDIDVEQEDARIDIDLDITDSDTVQLLVVEQAVVSLPFNETVDVFVGRFNSGVGAEEEDTTNLNFVSQGIIQETIDAATGLTGNTVEGAGIEFPFQQFTAKAAFLDEIAGNSDANSLLFQASGEVMPNINGEVSFLTQEKFDKVSNALSVGNILEANGTYRQDNWVVGGSFFSPGDDGDGLPANGFSGFGQFEINEKLKGVGRFESLKFNSFTDANNQKKSIPDATSFSLGAVYQYAKNIQVKGQFQSVNSVVFSRNGQTLTVLQKQDGSVEKKKFSQILIEGIVTFGE